VTQVKVNIPPALFTAPSGQRYAISGSVWIPVPDSTTFDDLDRYMVVERPTLPSNRGSRFWTVKGSKGNEYRVMERDGQWGCSCPGYGFRRKCRHIEETRNANR